MRFRISPEWEARAIAEGNARQDYAEGARLANYGREIGSIKERANHIMGCRCEIAVAARLHLPWSAQVGILVGIDVGGKVEVRGRRIPGKGTDLACRIGRDKPNRPYVLIHCFDTGEFEIIGWLYGWECAARANDCLVRYEITYVPPPYHAFVELEELVRKSAVQLQLDLA